LRTPVPVIRRTPIPVIKRTPVPREDDGPIDWPPDLRREVVKLVAEALVNQYRREHQSEAPTSPAA